MHSLYNRLGYRCRNTVCSAQCGHTPDGDTTISHQLFLIMPLWYKCPSCRPHAVYPLAAWLLQLMHQAVVLYRADPDPLGSWILGSPISIGRIFAPCNTCPFPSSACPASVHAFNYYPVCILPGPVTQFAKALSDLSQLCKHVRKTKKTGCLPLGPGRCCSRGPQWAAPYSP